MSSVVDVGDAFTLTFTSLPGVVVYDDWLDPDLIPVIDQELVPAVPAGSNTYPRTFTATRPGIWTARFLAAGAADDYHVRVVSSVGQPPPLAAVGDVVAQYGPLSDDEATLTRYLLRAASAMLRQQVPNLDAMARDGRLSPNVVALAPTNMTLRVLRNPDGLRAETTGPFSRTFDTSAAAGLLVVTPVDLANVTPGAAATPSSGWAPPSTIRVTPGMAPPPRWNKGRSGWH
jgi:hypothetical protein